MNDTHVPTAILSLLRLDDSVSGVADRFGVTEAQVREWLDVFVVAGVLALSEHRNVSKSTASKALFGITTCISTEEPLT